MEYSNEFLGSSAPGEMSTGTTILGMHFAGGVLLVADSRSSSGQFVGNRVCRKIVKLLPNIFVARCGSSADSQNLSLILKYYCQVLRQQLRIFNYEPDDSNLTSENMDVDPSHLANNTNNSQNSDMAQTFNYIYKQDQECGFKGPTVECVASLAQHFIHEYKDRLKCGLLFAGVDLSGKPDLFIVTPGGVMIRSDTYTSAGSGSVYVQAYLQDNYKKNQSKEECIKLAKQAVLYATKIDAMSGGLIRLISIDSHSVQEYCFNTETNS